MLNKRFETITRPRVADYSFVQRSVFRMSVYWLSDYITDWWNSKLSKCTLVKLQSVQTAEHYSSRSVSSWTTRPRLQSWKCINDAMIWQAELHIFRFLDIQNNYSGYLEKKSDIWKSILDIHNAALFFRDIPKTFLDIRNNYFRFRKTFCLISKILVFLDITKYYFGYQKKYFWYPE